MSAADLAAVLVAVTCLAVAAGLVLLVGQLRRATRDLRSAVEELRDHTLPAAERLRSQIHDIDDELRRVDGLVDTAQRITARADTLSKVTYRAVARPVINTAAVVKGTGRATRRLRKGRQADREAG